MKELLDCLERNEQAGIVYHREGIMGDYDEFDDLDDYDDDDPASYGYTETEAADVQ